MVDKMMRNLEVVILEYGRPVLTEYIDKLVYRVVLRKLRSKYD